MQTILIASTRRYSGKTGACVALVDELAARGLRVGYLKPYGGMPVHIGDVVTDQDAAFVNSHLSNPSPLASVCPVVRSRSFVEDLLAGAAVPGPAEVKAAFEAISADRDVMIVEAPSDLDQGASDGLAVADLLRMFPAKVLLVETCEVHEAPDRIVHAAETLGDAFAGVVLNRVKEGDRAFITESHLPFFTARGIDCFGVVPYDELLSSVTVQEIIDAVGGTVLCGGETRDRLVESYMVGAMGEDQALHFLSRKAHKAVITGGDRTEVALAALETSTAVLVLTGSMQPHASVLARASELDVCTILVDTDTLTAVERVDTMFGHVRLHGPGKSERMRKTMTDNVDLSALLAAVGIPA